MLYSEYEEVIAQIARPEDDSPAWPGYWESIMDLAQHVTHYDYHGFIVARIRYGQEIGQAKQKVARCLNCDVFPSEYHVPGCYFEQCPACISTLMACNCGCEVEEPGENVARAIFRPNPVVIGLFPHLV